MLAIENDQACNQRTFRLELIATEAAPMLALAATVLAFNPACLQSIFAGSLYVRLTERPSNGGLVDVSPCKHLIDLLAIQIWLMSRLLSVDNYFL